MSLLQDKNVLCIGNETFVLTKVKNIPTKKGIDKKTIGKLSSTGCKITTSGKICQCNCPDMFNPYSGCTECEHCTCEFGGDHRRYRTTN